MDVHKKVWDQNILDYFAINEFHCMKSHLLRSSAYEAADQPVDGYSVSLMFTIYIVKSR